MDWRASDSLYQNFITTFENGTLEQGSWHHEEHLGICFWYLNKTGFVDAVFKIKLGILKYNELYFVHQTQECGYHETITMFFIRIVNQFNKETTVAGAPLVERLDRLLAKYPKCLPVLHEYYSKPLLNSIEARVAWKSPDLKSIES